MSKTVLVTATNYSRYCADAKAMLEAEGIDVVENGFGRPMTFDELSARLGDVDAVIAGVDTWNDRVFDLAPRLKAIARFGVGVDNIDIDAAHRHGIAVTNAPGGNANAVAELTLGLILSAMRRIPYLHDALRGGAWDRFVGQELIGRRVGLLGFGNIARKIARKLSGFDVEVIAYDKFPDQAAATKLGVRMCEMDEVLSSSDILVMMMPSLPETRRLMDAGRFARMKPGSIFINTARGALVDEKALYDAIVSGHLQAAAIDVYEMEPALPDNPLFTLPQIVTTPHTAAETYETYTSIGRITAEAVIDVLANRQPRNQL
ncbi:phosphoglycerate dehydrogenase [Agrobacterium sp. TS43]|jgi:D-3-phosphoglycerate dehydrogenase|uniref:Phosphoglycerate dehydrogenase, D-isomer specific 2-hydroxyacid dehydrogenase, catalytic region n=2 Tax=Agrobacterium TaxID=357 RepID=A0A1S7U5U3_9HYPH|nr:MULTISPECIES: phosphoglycerate dehydrogenase [Agrobacterium]EPR15656.1 3-phosphoglycerate dehydrogenase [Agrobacterium radiobacter DSM 30147]KDR89374.1 phosphoglycerate dehydrogenase [Agrobacterium tumefaciens GW4]KVK40014.1 phosphoglycerate dehydrogenase [Agrobacterium sp. D14]KVK50824.1 phosphoglycerate dehydrogenase [Agrobacterium sp. JL28]KVK51151.1 phosphoglycerate dehydrogenase [Agrobacterium sp. LY4]